MNATFSLSSTYIGETLSIVSTVEGPLPARPIRFDGPRPNPRFSGYVRDHLGADGLLGEMARSIARDPCWPKGHPSYIVCVQHITDVHGANPLVLRKLRISWKMWRRAWARTGRHPFQDEDEARGEALSRQTRKFAPRQNIFEAAAESGLQMTRTGLAFCWNDVPGSPTQGHFNGNREPSMALYDDGENQSFFCHQCGIWGWPDQLKERTWQGKAR